MSSLIDDNKIGIGQVSELARAIRSIDWVQVQFEETEQLFDIIDGGTMAQLETLKTYLFQKKHKLLRSLLLSMGLKPKI